VTEAETLLQGEVPSDRLFREAGRVAADLMTAETGRRWSTPYKEPVLAVLVRRALEECAAPRSEPVAAGGGR
jgi:carbon-monoxide dehydrogenase medium subunit/xanthine dehydrogenase FAD-binding subunit